MHGTARTASARARDPTDPVPGIPWRRLAALGSHMVAGSDGGDQNGGGRRPSPTRPPHRGLGRGEKGAAAPAAHHEEDGEVEENRRRAEEGESSGGVLAELGEDGDGVVDFERPRHGFFEEEVEDGKAKLVVVFDPSGATQSLSPIRSETSKSCSTEPCSPLRRHHDASVGPACQQFNFFGK